MFADQRDVSGDVEVLEEFGLDVLNQDTIPYARYLQNGRVLLNRFYPPPTDYRLNCRT